MSANRRLSLASLIFALGVFGASSQVAAQFGPPPPPPHAPHPRPTPESIAQGKTLFEGTCAVCHGIDGSGANGPNIREAATNLGPEGLYNTIYSGIFGSGMPTFSQLGEEKIWLLVNYVSSLGHEGAGMAFGDAKKGKEVYDANGCSTCHMVAGTGGDLGPDLTKIGAQRTADFLHDVLLDPGAHLPATDTALQERAGYPAYVMYRAVTANGKVVEGMRVDEDSFTIQLRDASGQLHSLRKLSLQKLEAEPGKSFMPSYKDKLSETQLNDLVAYISSLGGAQ
ncbi:MAG: c-type cytochrome [Candidatus Acidiferrales bacterium]|jgi:putative heme-binding domain-containing protein